MGSALLLAVVATARAGCDVGAVVDAAESAGPRAEIERIDPLRADLTSAARCAAPATANLLARFWLAQGALLWVGDRRDEAVDALATASRLNPGITDSGYGPDFVALQAEAAAVAPQPGKLELSGAPAPLRVYLDGQLWAGEAVEDGWHLVQVAQADEAHASWAQLLFLAPGGHVSLQVDGVTPHVAPAPTPAPVPIAPVPVPVPVPVVRHSHAPAWVIGSGLALEAVAAGFAGYALSLTGDIRSAPSIPSLDATYNRQKFAGYTAYGLAGGGLAVCGVGVALAFGEGGR